MRRGEDTMISLPTLRGRWRGLGGTVLAAMLAGVLAAPDGAPPGAGAAAGARRQRPGATAPDSVKLSRRPARLPGRADRPLSRTRCSRRSSWPRRTRSTSIAAQQWLDKNSSLKGEALDEGGDGTGLGSQRPGAGLAPGRSQGPERERQVDRGPRRRVPRAAERRHGGRPADARRRRRTRARSRPASSRRSRRR